MRIINAGIGLVMLLVSLVGAATWLAYSHPLKLQERKIVNAGQQAPAGNQQRDTRTEGGGGGPPAEIITVEEAGPFTEVTAESGTVTGMAETEKGARAVVMAKAPSRSAPSATAVAGKLQADTQAYTKYRREYEVYADRILGRSRDDDGGRP